MIRSSLSLLALLLALGLFLLGCPQGAGGLDDDDSSGADDDDDAVDDDDAADDDDATDDDDITPEDDDDATPPVPEVTAVHPPNGTPDHFIHENLWVDFDVVGAEATVTLADAAGLDIPGEQVWVAETRLSFNPTAPLTYGTHYVASVTWLAGEADDVHTWEFDTSTDGDTPTGADLVGKTFAYDLNAGQVVAPLGGEQLLAQFAGVFLQGVVSQTATEIGFLAAVDTDGGEPPEQDMCLESINLDEQQATTWQDPFFEAGPADVPQTLNIPGFGILDMTFRDVVVSGLFTASTFGGDVDSITEGTFSTVIDIRDAGMGDVCAKLGLFLPGLVCLPCPHELTAEQCVFFDIIDLPAAEVPLLTLVEVTTTDIEANPDCE